jgi:hypothetical protein
VTAGTVFEDSRKPLRLWFQVMWLMMAHKTGLSAKGLCDVYEFGSYQTAWGWLHKLRSVMIRTGRERLHGRVEIDETQSCPFGDFSAETMVGGHASWCSETGTFAGVSR